MAEVDAGQAEAAVPKVRYAELALPVAERWWELGRLDDFLGWNGLLPWAGESSCVFHSHWQGVVANVDHQYFSI